jgi:hypothetical protein
MVLDMRMDAIMVIILMMMMESITSGVTMAAILLVSKG